MLLKIIVAIISIAITWHMVDYVFDRNMMAEIYSPDADSISIPIITNQVLLLALGFLILPTTLLASTRVMKQLSKLTLQSHKLQQMESKLLFEKYPSIC